MTSPASAAHSYPHFLVVGVMKCGTSTVHEHICTHPRVVRAFTKELHYFTRDFAGRVPLGSWSKEYHELLGWQGDPNDGMLYGEASPSYIVVPQRLYDFNPDVKIVIMLRDPVTRALSQIRQYEEKSFRLKEGGYLAHMKSAADLSKVDVVLDSIYFNRVQKFLDVFPPENVAVVSFEEMASDPQAVMNEVFAFLNLDPVAIETGYVGAATRKERTPEQQEIKSILTDYFFENRGKLHQLLKARNARLIPSASDWFDKY